MLLIKDDKIVYDAPINTSLAGRQCDYIVLTQGDWGTLSKMAHSGSKTDEGKLVGLLNYMELKYRPRELIKPFPLEIS